MKYIILITIVALFGCQENSNLRTIIQSQNDFVDFEYEQLLHDIKAKSTTNPQKFIEPKNEILFIKEIDSTLQSHVNLNENIEKHISDYFTSLTRLRLNREAEETILEYKKKFDNNIKSYNSLSDNEKNLILLNLKTVRNYTIRILLSELELTNFTFNKLYPIVISKNESVKLGEIYSAQIIMAGIDTTRNPIIKVEGSLIPINENGEAIVNIKTNKRGIHYLNGEVNWVHENTGQILIFPFESSYKVE